jgi:5-methylcytosine-specific restriction protein A
MAGYCDACKRTRSASTANDARRGSSTARGYGYKWQQARAYWLKLHPLCVDPYSDHGVRVVEGKHVDHIVPHGNDFSTHGLFWSRSNWQTLCAECHSKKTSREDGGFGRYTGGG